MVCCSPLSLGSRQSSRSPSPGRRRGSPSVGEKGAYVVQAGRLIKQALSYEKNAEYQEAFDLFKAGVDVLLNGVQSEWFIPCTGMLFLCMYPYSSRLDTYMYSSHHHCLHVSGCAFCIHVYFTYCHKDTIVYV